jgi:hypothetical protein
MSAGEEGDIESKGDFKSNFTQWRIDNKVDVFDETSNGVNFGMVWIDVEDNPSSGCSWNDWSYDSNCNFIMQLIDAVAPHNK